MADIPLTNRGEAIAYLTSRPKFGTGLGLQRMQDALSALKPALWYADGRAIHVAGSQGKGTVATLTATILETLGYRTGRYLSPHLFHFEERIAIGGEEIEASALIEATQSFYRYEQTYLALHPGDRFGAFEALTATAFHAFTKADIDVAVLEAGIGGRFDATRAAKGAIVALTGIDHEHVGLLGPTAEHILYDKADLCPAGGLLVAGRLAPELKRRLGAYGAIRGMNILYTDEKAQFANIRHEMAGTCADIDLDGMVLKDLRTRVHGDAQLCNVALALLLVRAWIERKGRETPIAHITEAARTALACTSIPLRFECIDEDPLTIADVAHTPASAYALADTVRAVRPAQPLVLLVGISDDKPAAAILEPLLPLAAAVIYTKSHRGIAPESLAALSHAKPDRPAVSIGDPAEAFAYAKARARRDGRALLVTGSLFLAAQAKCIAAGQDPAALEFL